MKHYEEFTAFDDRIVRIPTDAYAWQLYDDGGGYEQAAKEMTKTLKQALLTFHRKDAIEMMRIVLVKYADLGAMDTEPRCIAERCLTEGRGGDYSWTL